jgi:class 3 adenylate cyclase
VVCSRQISGSLALSYERAERRLTAILAADVAGYSRLMGADEEGTLAQLKSHRRALVDPKIAEHRGRIVKTTGDGMLVEFASVVDALRCAVEVQRGMTARNAEVPQDKRIEFRVGIHQGDVIIEGGDIYGDGVNVAARLEGLAETREGISEALRLFYRAIELDPDFASAYGMAAFCYTRRKAHGWMIDRDQDIAEMSRLARRAVELGKDDAVALCTAGFALAHAYDRNGGAAFIDRALVLNPNLAAAWLYSGWVNVWLGKPALAIEHLARAMRLSPLDPLIYMMRAATAHAHFFASRYDEASSWAEMVLREQPDDYPGLRIAAASSALAAREEEANTLCKRLRQINPALRVSNLRHVLGPYGPEALAKYEEGLRKAGLPE